jgi:hypothetical protein
MSKVFLPPRPDATVGTPLLKKEGKCFFIKYYNFLLLYKEVYPRSPAGERGGGGDF